MNNRSFWEREGVEETPIKDLPKGQWIIRQSQLYVVVSTLEERNKEIEVVSFYGDVDLIPSSELVEAVTVRAIVFRTRNAKDE